MNIKFLVVVIVVLSICKSSMVNAQETQENLIQALGASGIDPNSASLFGKELPPSGVEGNYYMFSQRTLGDIEMKSGKVYKSQQLQYDLYKNELEVLIKNSIYVFPNANVKSLILYEDVDRKFVNGLDYEFLGDSLVGFLEVLVEGEITLLSSTVLSIKKPTYRPETNFGNRNYVVSKKSELFITKGKILVKLTNKNKLNYKWFSKKEDAVHYFKKNKLDLYDKIDAIFAVQYYNSH